MNLTKFNPLPTLKHFTWEEVMCKCGADHAQGEIPESYRAWMVFVDRTIRVNADFPFHVSSGWRCPLHPVEQGKSAPGPHQIAAIDILCSHQNADKLLNVAYAAGVPRKGLSQHGDVSKRFVHLDPLPPAPHRPSPHIWTYPQ